MRGRLAKPAISGGESHPRIDRQRLLLDLEAGELLLELRDAGVRDRLDGLRLDLGVPDLQLLDLLSERRRRAAEQGGGGGGAREEAAASMRP